MGAPPTDEPGVQPTREVPEGLPRHADHRQQIGTQRAAYQMNGRELDGQPCADDRGAERVIVAGRLRRTRVRGHLPAEQMAVATAWADLRAGETDAGGSADTSG